MKVNFKGNEVSLKGKQIKVGDEAKKVSLKGRDLSEVKIGEGTQIILSVPSLDTGVCAAEAREFNEKIANYPGAQVVIVSMDLPFAAARFCAAEGIENVVVASDFVAREFGENYGVIINEGALEGLLARAVFVIKEGKIVYKEIVSEITQMPDIAALDAFFGVKASCCCSCSCE